MLVKRKLLIAIVAIVIVASVGFAGYQYASMAGPTKLSFRLAAAQSFGAADFTSWHIAKDRGLFGKYVPGAELVDLRGGTGELVRAMADGTVQVGLGVTDGFIVGITKGVDIKIVAIYKTNPIRFGVFVGTDSPVKTMGGFKGKTLGISSPGSATYILLLLLAKQNGWKLGEDIKFAPLGDLQANVAAAKKGAIDGMIWATDAVTPFLEKGELRMVFDATGTYPKPWPSHAIAARSDFIRNHSDAVSGAVKTLGDANRIFHDPKEKQYVLSLETQIYKLSRSAAEEQYVYVKYSLDGAIQRSGLSNIVEVLFGAKTIRNAPDIGTLYVQGFAPVVS